MLVYRLGIFYPEAKCGIYNLSGIKVCDNAKLALPPPRPVSPCHCPKHAAHQKLFILKQGQGKGGVLAPKRACRQVKSVTENEPRVACKFDNEATPDMPKRIRQGRLQREGGREREVRREGESERAVRRGFAQGAAKVLHSFFYRFLPVSLFPAPSSHSLPPVTTPLCCSKAIAVWPPFCLAFKKHLKKHTHTQCKGRGGRRQRGGVHKQRLQFCKLSWNGKMLFQSSEREPKRNENARKCRRQLLD